MGTLVLVRHGESQWNQCHRFTGWVDVPLSKNGVKEAERCAVHCKRFEFSLAFTSALERAHETLLIILSQQNRTGIFQHERDPRYSRWLHLSNHCGGSDMPIYATSILNERYYGLLQGMEKEMAEQKYGKERVFAWRRGFNDRPPRGESLRDVERRVHPYFHKHIDPHIRRGETVLLAGHGNTLRTVIKKLERISTDDISFVDLPEAQPIVYTFKRGAYKRTAGEYQFTRPLR